MGIIGGFPKYIIGVLLSVGFVSMYIFGGTLITFYNTVSQLLSGNFINTFLEYFIYSALPPTSLEHVILQAVIGAVVAGVLWFIAMAARIGISF